MLFENPYKTLVNFTKSREKAFERFRMLTSGRVEAITRINKFMDLRKFKPAEELITDIKLIKNEIFLILPGSHSRYQRQRKRILSLLNPQ